MVSQSFAISQQFIAPVVTSDGLVVVPVVASDALMLVPMHAPAESPEPPAPEPGLTEPEPGPPEPHPSDVLTPNKRQNTPYLKIALRAGMNWAAYSNDRYLDNTQLDVGRTSGEGDIYAHASGFGFGGGFEVEYPINTGLSVAGTAEFARAHFGSSGLVGEDCESLDGSVHLDTSHHEWSTDLSYVKLGAVGKLSFTSFYFVAGLHGSRLITSRVQRTRAFDDPTCTFPGGGASNRIVEDDVLTDATSLLLSMRLGFGLIYPLADRLTFSPEVTLDFGMSSLNKSPESDLDIYTLSAVLRYELR